MKLILIALVSALLSAEKVSGQGYVFLANVSMDLTTEKTIYDADTREPLTSAYVAQLFAGVRGTSASNLRPVDIPVTFFDQPFPGLFLGPEVLIPGVPAGRTATLEVRVWPGIFASWETATSAALNDPNLRVGRSGIFSMTTGNAGLAPEVVFYMPDFTVGVVPEPGMGILLGLGGLMLSRLKPGRFRLRCRGLDEATHPRLIFVPLCLHFSFGCRNLTGLLTPVRGTSGESSGNGKTPGTRRN